MACYGGECKPSCPMYDVHHPWIIECGACGNKVLSWYAKDGMCPSCGSALDMRRGKPLTEE